MGECFTAGPEEEKKIWIDFKAPEAVERVVLVKNCRDHVILYGRGKQMLFDYRQEPPCDIYYVRAVTVKGRYCWSSPIWVSGESSRSAAS